MPGLVCRYAGRFAALGRGQHCVASPLGAWLLLALAAPAASGELAENIIEALGTDAATARQAATELLTHPHPAVSAASAAWARDGLAGLDDWISGLPAVVESGAMPSRDEADVWAREHSLGLIERFPIDVSRVAVLLASALATRVRWVSPFELADAADLGGPWSSAVTRVLRTPAGGGHRRQRVHRGLIVDTERAGRVAVHSARADSLEVVSVLAAAEVAATDVLAAGHEIAVALTSGGQANPVNAVSLFDLPLGEQPLWTITEVQASSQGEHVEALLPAWHAESEHDLLAEDLLRFEAAGRALQQPGRLPDPIDAAQSAVARYTRRGFEAAALTRIGFPTSGRAAPPPGPFRTATLRFGHPFAVIAATRAHTRDDPWRALPVFAAWVASPDNAHE